MFAQRMSLLLLLGAAPLQILSSDANGFLSPKRAMQVKKELRDVLDEVLGLGHGLHKAQIQRIEQVMTPLFGSLPKNHKGSLSAPVMRYAVQRYFGQQNAWVLKGFEAHSVTSNVSEFSDGALVLKGKVPEYIQLAIEEKFASNGFALKDAVGIIAALETLTSDEVLHAIQTSFQLNSLSTRETLSHQQLVEVLSSYLIVGILEGDYGDAEQHMGDKANVSSWYPHWENTFAFVLDVAENDAFAQQALSNPFHSRTFSFEDASRIGQAITQQFGPWSSHECHEIKESLVDMDVHGTGRVKLSDFYTSKKNGSWQFHEASDYLRQLGALDESSEKLGPQVIIPNYIQGMSNCITTTPLYSVCCQSECNEVYQYLEAVLPPSSDATWSADHLVGAIEEMANQNVSAALISRLEEVSAHHDGKIPLHGRLLAQWLHFVFPHECPYPHLAETINPLTSSAWEESVGGDTYSASLAEVEQFLEAEAASIPSSPEAGLAMWNLQEYSMQSKTSSDFGFLLEPMSLVRILPIIALLASFAVLVFKEAPKVMRLTGHNSKKAEFSI